MAMWERYLQEQQARGVDELREWLRIPSISSLPEHAADVQRAGAWLAAKMRAIGLEQVQLLPTGGHPALYAEWLRAPGQPTALLYGHFDVQPVDPLELWSTPPFAAEVRDGRIYARGASDNKGTFFAALGAVEALLQSGGALPINIKCLVEGQEEIGSPQMGDFVAAHKELLACDVVINTDAGQWSETEPSLSVGLRGVCDVEVTIENANSDLHSGGFGGAVANPLHALVELLTSLHSPQGVVTVAGFYDDVEALSAAERARIAAVPFDEAAYMAELGIAGVFGEPGYSTLERTWVRPTLELNGLWGGFQGAGTKTVLPREAHAKITCRLVPHQDPFIVRDLVVAHLRAHQPPGVRLTVIPHGAVAWPYVVPWEHPVNQAAREVLRESYGREPFATRSGGSVPMCEIFLRHLGAYAISFGFGLRDERAHAPDEFFRLASLARGQVATAKLLERLARA